MNTQFYPLYLGLLPQKDKIGVCQIEGDIAKPRSAHGWVDSGASASDLDLEQVMARPHFALMCRGKADLAIEQVVQEKSRHKVNTNSVLKTREQE